MRPVTDCYCDVIPTVRNQTPVLILQHRKEFPHPFNTARLVNLALQNSQLVIKRVSEFQGELAQRILPGAGLLYPGKDAMDLNDLAPAERPEQLVVLDGTWHHAKTMYRDLPVLHDLPKYRINPRSPGNYRIRQEPTMDSLATVEAIVAALEILEPDTVAIEKMLDAFNHMVERQLAHGKTGTGYSHNRKRMRTPINMPSVILKDLNKVVVAYGESVGFERRAHSKSEPRLPVYWVAQRLVSGECFKRAIRQPVFQPTDEVLRHLELTMEDFDQAVSVEEFRGAWGEFLRSDDSLVVFNPSTLKLLENVKADVVPSYNLKTVHFDPQRKYSTLEQFFQANDCRRDPPELPGRAGKRLANVKAFVHFLNQLGQESLQ